MFINYNRISREMWITDQNGTVRARKTATKGEKMVNAAGQFLTDHGFARSGDYMLVASGSPMRRAKLVPSSMYGQRGTGPVHASAVSRVLNEKYPPGRWNVYQSGDRVRVEGPHEAEAVRYLNAKGYRVEPQTQYEMLVTGKVSD